MHSFCSYTLAPTLTLTPTRLHQHAYTNTLTPTRSRQHAYTNTLTPTATAVVTIFGGQTPRRYHQIHHQIPIKFSDNPGTGTRYQRWYTHRPHTRIHTHKVERVIKSGQGEGDKSYEATKDANGNPFKFRQDHGTQTSLAKSQI